MYKHTLKTIGTSFDGNMVLCPPELQKTVKKENLIQILQHFSGIRKSTCNFGDDVIYIKIFNINVVYCAGPTWKQCKRLARLEELHQQKSFSNIFEILEGPKV